MPTMISYSVGYTAVDAASSTVTVTPPPVYAAGDFLVMGVIAGGTSAAVAPAGAPSGWTAPPGLGTLGVWYKTATDAEPASYTVTLAASATAAVFVAAYPAATVAASAFYASANGVASYSPPFPSGVTSSQTVLLVGAAVSDGTNAGWGGASLNLPAGWTTQVPVFGQSLPDDTPGAMPCVTGLCDVTGPAATPVLVSPLLCQVFAGYLVLDVTGTADTLGVTATVNYPEGTPGMALTVKALTGAASPQAIASGGATVPFYANAVSQAPQAAITPNATGSLIYGAMAQNFAVTAGDSFTANAATTLSQNVADSTWSAIYATLESAAATTAGTAVTLGGTAPANAYTTAALAEILAAPGSSLSETATATAAGTVPGDFATTAVAQTAIFRTAPAAGTLLVAMVSANSRFGNGNATVTITDTAGLSWTQLAAQPYPSYSGVWIAQVPSATGGEILDESGANVLDEAGADVLDESGTVPPGTVTGAVARVTVTAVPGTFPGAVTVTGTSRVTVTAVPGTASAGSTATSDILDEAGNPVLDESGADVLDESGGSPVPPPSFTGTWTAARAGLPGDPTAVNAAAQAAQFLTTHGIAVTRHGNRAWQPATGSGISTAFGFNAPLLPAYDVSQPVTLPAGVTAAGRALIPLMPSGTGADLQVRLCPDNGSGSPDLTTVLAQAVIPASHVTALAAAAGLATAPGPLQTAQFNAVLLGPVTSQPWAAPAVSSAGAGNYSAAITTGNWTIFAGGYGTTAPITQVTTVRYQGSGLVGGAVPVSPLPQAAYFQVAAATTDTLVIAGGNSGTAWLSSAWTASWDGNGTVGAWSAQPALPAPCAYGAMAAIGGSVYVLAGSRDGTPAGASAAVWQAPVSAGSVSAWQPAPSLPVPCSRAYLAAAGNWLVCAGGLSTAGTPLTATWAAQAAPDGTLGPWQPGPPLPYPAYAYAPGWNLAAAGTAVIIVSGLTTGGSVLTSAMSLTVSADGPAPEWQLQTYELDVDGTYQTAAYPSGNGGNWTIAGFHLNSYATAQAYPVPLMSVPLPATGLTPGATYHLVLHMEGATAAGSLALGLCASTGTPLLYAAPGSGGPWTPAPGLQVSAILYDQSAGSPVLHLAEDAGARVTTLARDSAGNLTGILDACAFPAGSPEAVLSAVTQVTWEGGRPSGLVNLA